MEAIKMNAVSEKQRTYAMKVRADALNGLEQFRAIFQDSTSFYGKNMLSIYNAGRGLILEISDAAYMIENAALIAEETKAFAEKWEQHYNYCKQHGKKPHSAQLILKCAAPTATGCRYLTADMLTEQN